MPGGFARLPNAVYDRIPQIGPMAALVYWSLSYHADRAGRCYPSHQSIADELGISPRAVIRAIAVLEAANLITVQRANDGKTRNRYALLPILTTSDSQSPVTHSHRGSDSQSLPPVTHSHGGSDCESQEPYPDNQIHGTIPTNQTHPPTPQRGNGVCAEEGGHLSTTGKNTEGFAAFWEAYPRQQAKGAARQAWSKLHPDADLQARIMASLTRLKQSHDWTKEGGRYVPAPAKWLASEGWDDEPNAYSAPKGRTNDSQYRPGMEGDLYE